MPPVTQALILVNVVVYLIQMLVGMGPLAALEWPIRLFGLWPIGTVGIEPGFAVWQLVSYGFLHGDMWHLLLNMFMLWVFGSQIEQLFGARFYATYFFVCIVAAGIAQLAVAMVIGGGAYPTIGASGGVLGVVLAFGMYFPHRRIMLIFPPIPMPAWVMVTGVVIIELFYGVSGYAPGVANFAHLGGMLGGFVMILYRRNWRL